MKPHFINLFNEAQGRGHGDSRGRAIGDDHVDQHAQLALQIVLVLDQHVHFVEEQLLAQHMRALGDCVLLGRC
jgi:hypothetical protein